MKCQEEIEKRPSLVIDNEMVSYDVPQPIVLFSY